jgi:hypothetical protein
LAGRQPIQIDLAEDLIVWADWVASGGWWATWWRTWPAPVVGVFGDRSRSLGEDEEWSTEPLCQRTSAYRCAFGGLLFAAGVAVGASARRRRPAVTARQ